MQSAEINTCQSEWEWKAFPERESNCCGRQDGTFFKPWAWKSRADLCAVVTCLMSLLTHVLSHLADKRKKRKSKTGELFKQVCKHITAFYFWSEIDWSNLMLHLITNFHLIMQEFQINYKWKYCESLSGHRTLIYERDFMTWYVGMMALLLPCSRLFQFLSELKSWEHTGYWNLAGAQRKSPAALSICARYFLCSKFY